MNRIELENICIIKNGYAFKSDEYKSIGVPLLRISNFNDGDVYIDENTIFVDPQYLKTKSDFIVEKGDILIALSGATTGKYGFYNFDYPSLLNQRIGLLKSGTSQKLHDRYFYFYLTILKNEILRNAGGAAQPNISTKTIGKFQIPLPPLATQKRLTAILDAADLYRQTTKALVAKYDQLAQSLFLEMFGDPVNNQKKWVIKQFGSIYKILRYGTGSPPEYIDNGIPFVRATNIKMGGVVEKGMVYISKSEAAKIEKCKLNEGDMIIVRSGANTGDCCRIPEKYHGAYGGFDMIIEIDEPFSTFYNFLLNTDGGKAILKPFTRRAGQPHLNSTQIFELELITPPISLQTQFATRIQLIEAQKQQALAALQKSEILFNSLLQKAFKGELVD